MIFRLDPPSGLAESYFDIEFFASFEKTHKTVLTIYNDTSEERLDILGVVAGYILSGNSVVIKNDTQIRGHFNIFNNDKMNKKFGVYGSVKIRCHLEHFDEEDKSVGSEEETVVFYNESQSLDSEIIPFDLLIDNTEVDIDNNEPLKVTLISGLTKRYEICVKSLDGKHTCHVEISAKQGKTEIHIPGEMLFYDLQLRESHKKKFQLYYVRFEGSNFSRMANRKYIPIDNTSLKFLVKGGICPPPQQRIDPTGQRLSNSFIISDRYLVFCPKEFSGFAPKSEFSKEKLMDLTMMVYEGQHMQYLAKQIRQFSDTDSTFDDVKQTERTIERGRHAEARKIRPQISSNQIQLMRGIAGTYNTISSRFNNQKVAIPGGAVESFSTRTGQQHSSGSGCLPCSRKRKNNA